MIVILELYKSKVKESIKKLVNENQLNEAQELIVEYEKVVEEDVEIYSIKAVIAIMNNDLYKAEKNLIKSIKNFGELFDLTYNLAYIYVLQSNNPKAYYYYLKALNDCKDEQIKNEISIIMDSLRKEEEVEAYIKRKKSISYCSNISTFRWFRSTKNIKICKVFKRI